MTDHADMLRPDPSLIERIGGREMVERIIDTLYEGVLADPLLQPIFRQNFDRSHSKDFFTEWMGGEPRYSRSAKHWRGTQRAHYRFFITQPMAGRWVFYMKRALKRCGISDDMRKEIIGKLAPLARALVNNERLTPDKVHLTGHGLTIQSPEFWQIEALRISAREGDLESIRDAVTGDPEVATRRGSNGRTLLWEAAGAGQDRVVDFLLDSGAPVNMPGCTAIDTDFLDLLANEPGPLVMTAPHVFAVSAGHHQIAARLLAHGAVEDVFSCAYTGDVDRVAELIKHDAELVLAEDPADDFHRITALHHAVAGGQLAVAELLVNHGARVQPYSMWLLTYAALRNHAPIVALLLDHGADARQTLCLGPLDRVQRPVADMLIARGADIDHHPAHGSLLYHLCRHGDDPVMRRRIRALLDYGADPNAQGRWGDSPLHAAVRAGSAELIEWLMQAGARVEGINDERDPPIFGFQGSHVGDPVACLEVLLRHGANLEMRNHWGETILFHFIRQGHAEAVSWLLDHGADPDACNQRNHSARELATQSRKAKAADIARLLAH